MILDASDTIEEFEFEDEEEIDADLWMSPGKEFNKAKQLLESEGV